MNERAYLSWKRGNEQYGNDPRDLNEFYNILFINFGWYCDSNKYY